MLKISWPKQLFKIYLRLVVLNNYLNVAKNDSSWKWSDPGVKNM